MSGVCGEGPSSHNGMTWSTTTTLLILILVYTSVHVCVPCAILASQCCRNYLQWFYACVAHSKILRNLMPSEYIHVAVCPSGSPVSHKACLPCQLKHCPGHALYILPRVLAILHHVQLYDHSSMSANDYASQ